MRLPERGEKGFTLIELLIVVAILGVLAAVIIPNVGRFIGAGQSEASDTELANVQTAVIQMMVDNDLAALPNPVDNVSNATDNMSLFPDSASACGTDKLVGPVQGGGRDNYTSGGDLDGYILYHHDIYADNDNTTDLASYVAAETTKGTYYVDADGTVHQATSGY